MATIYHIAKLEEWERAKRVGIYETSSLASEGFIHCSRSDQLIRTANRFFSGQQGLVLLEIDTALVTSEIRYENSEGGTEVFPHIYGTLNLNSVVQVMAFEHGANGSFVMPIGIST